MCDHECVSVCVCVSVFDTVEKKFDLKRVFQRQHCDPILNENSNRAVSLSVGYLFLAHSFFFFFLQFPPFLTSVLLCSVCP